MHLDEKLLNDIGGWQEMKRARGMWQSGLVLSARYQEPMLRGLIREGGTEYRAGLVVKSKINVENICSCQESRRWGKICAHSLAIGLACVHGERNGAMAEKKQEAAAQSKESEAGNANQLPPGFTIAEHAAPTLTLVIPPKWRELFTNNQPLTIACEWTEPSGKKQMLGALPPGQRPVTSGLGKILGWLWQLTGRGKLPAMLQLETQQFLEMLDQIDPNESHVLITPGREKPLALGAKPIHPRLEVEELDGGGISLAVEMMPGVTPLAAGDRVWLWNDSAKRLERLAAPLPAHYQSILTAPVRLEDPQQAATFLANEYPTLGQWFHLAPLPGHLAPASGAAPAVSGGEGSPGRPEVVLELDGSLNAMTAMLQFRYGQRLLTAGVTPRNEGVTFLDPEGKRRSRHPAFEQECLERLLNWRFSNPDRHGRMTLRGEREILAFFVREYPKLEKEWSVTLGDRFGRVAQRFDRVTPEMEVRGTGEDWFEVGVTFADARGRNWSQQEIQRLLRSGRSYEKSDDGRITLVDENDMSSMESFLRDCDPVQGAGGYRLHRRHASMLDQVVGEGGRMKGRDRLKAWLPEGTRQLELGPFETILRPYQKEGVQWLNFLGANGLGGILADEMGLGKTVQTLAFLAQSDRAGLPSLIVCPSSLVWNWERESARFAPDLRVVRYEGQQRKRLHSELEKADIVMTSYPILRRDIKILKELSYFCVTLDEAHHIKNPETQNAKAAVDLDAGIRLVLTGTPIENSLLDLWSLMSFANPGLLGDRENFKASYMLANEPQDITLLRKRLRPVIKRRTKLEKVRELPPKMTQVHWAEPTEAQMTCYHSVVQGIEALKSQANAEKHAGKRRAILLTGLLRLRQAACDLRLLQDDDMSPLESSGKLAAFVELLQEMQDGGQRVLVFSQFVRMLKLLEQYLRDESIDYNYLDGSTKHREAVVKEFQEGTAPVFLISLKAGGVGLNLTAADNVVIFDPWWNPAAEEQAADRAHRIGQDKPVSVYKMITRGTVEEKILALQEKKREMAGALFEDGELSTAGLTTDELEELLR